MENGWHGNLVPSLAEDWSTSKFDGRLVTRFVRVLNGRCGRWRTRRSNCSRLWLVWNTLLIKIRRTSISSGLNQRLWWLCKENYRLQTSWCCDDYTLQYTLNKTWNFLNSKTTNGILFPIAQTWRVKAMILVNQTMKSTCNGPFLLNLLHQNHPLYWKDRQLLG